MSLPIFVLGTALALPAGVVTEQADEQAAAFLPDDVLVAVTIEAPDRQLASIRGFLDAHEAALAGLHTAISANPELVRAQIFANGIAATADTDTWTGAGAVLGREVVLGFRPRGDKPAFIVAALARDAVMRSKVVDTLHATIGVTRGDEPAPGATVDIAGVPALRLGDVFECSVDDAVVISNDRDLLESALAAHAAGTGRLVDDATYQSAADRVPDGAAAWARLHIPTLRAIVAAQDDGTQRIAQPLGGVLFGGWSHAITRAEELVAWIEADPAGLVVNVDAPIGALDPAFDGFLAPEVGRSAPLRVDDAIAMITAERGWADLFGERERFLTLGGSAQFGNFTSTLTTLLGGVDFVEDVMANVTGPVQVVVRAAERAEGLDPTPPLPAFALVAPIGGDDVEELARRLTSGALSTASIVNMEQTRQSGEGYTVDVEEYRGSRLVTMGLTPPPPGPANVRYNFAPASGVFGDRFVIASTRDVALHLADAALDGDHLGGVRQDRLHIDGARVVSALREAREELVAQRMVKEDQSRADAERDIDAILSLIGLARTLDVDAAIEPGSARARARLSFTAGGGG